MEVRIGQVLVDCGVLSSQQVDLILARQQEGGEPFGLLAEQLFQIEPELIEQAWAWQYARVTRTVDPLLEDYEERALHLVTRRQAWQFRVLPIRFDDLELMMATTQQYLRRALGFATNVIGVPTYLVLSEPAKLGGALCRHYPLPGMTPASVNDDGMDRLLAGPQKRPRRSGAVHGETRT